MELSIQVHYSETFNLLCPVQLKYIYMSQYYILRSLLSARNGNSNHWLAVGGVSL